MHAFTNVQHVHAEHRRFQLSGNPLLARRTAHSCRFSRPGSSLVVVLLRCPHTSDVDRLPRSPSPFLIEGAVRVIRCSIWLDEIQSLGHISATPPRRSRDLATPVVAAFSLLASTGTAVLVARSLFFGLSRDERNSAVDMTRILVVLRKLQNK